MISETIVIISCGGAKGKTPSTAAALYTGSYFRSAILTAKAIAPGAHFILSAKHGLMRPWHRIGPYEMTLDDPGSITLEHLREQARADPGIRGKRVIALCGSKYAGMIRQIWTDVEAPLDGLSIGYQRSVLKAMRDTWPVLDRAIAARCPRCGALPYLKCHDDDGQRAPGVLMHAARAEAWRAFRAEAWRASCPEGAARAAAG